MPALVAINGLGRIGRAFLKLAVTEPQIKIVAVNDLATPENLAYLLRYDSAYGPSNLEIKTGPGSFEINGQSIKFFQEKDPSKLPWGSLGIQVVVESTGFFESYAAARAHLEAGAHRVVVSAPLKDEPPAGLGGATVLMGINEEKFAGTQITSNASCTTNSASPVIQILDEAIGVEKAMLSTIHAYTASQKLVDAPDAGDFRRGRAAAANIVPSTTGAAIAVTKALPQLTGLFDGIAIRVPVITGSLSDITFIAKRPTSVEEINKVLRAAAALPRWQGIFKASDEPLVSRDIAGSPYGAIADLGMTKVVGGNLVKVLAWYDNELGYTHTLLRHVLAAAKV